MRKGQFQTQSSKKNEDKITIFIQVEVSSINFCFGWNWNSLAPSYPILDKKGTGTVKGNKIKLKIKIKNADEANCFRVHPPHPQSGNQDGGRPILG